MIGKKWRKKAEALAAQAPDIWGQIEEIEARMAIVKPPGSFTVNDYARKKGVDRNLARNRIDRMLRVGQIVKHKCPGTSAVYYTIK